jgi:polyisoprenoid-binding protein YceI
MKRTFFLVSVLAAVVVIAIAAYVLRPSAQASAPIQATPLPTQVRPTADPTQAANAPQAASPTATESAAIAAASNDLTGQVTYQIAQSESQVSFSVQEVLRGSPLTAVGTTNQVAGELAIDFDNASAQLGPVQVDARTLKTDNNFRNRAINNEILDTAQYEYITFVPTAITGLPSSIAIGDTVTFQISGNLTIRDVTKPVTFEVKVTLVSKDRLEGQASATVLRSDYNLNIPSVPQVANVSNEVLVEINFVAAAK